MFGTIGSRGGRRLATTLGATAVLGLVLAAPGRAATTIDVLDGITYVETDEQPLGASAQARPAARCPAGKHVVGGGVRWDSMGFPTYLSSSFPIDGADRDRIPDDGWRGEVEDRFDIASSVEVAAICLRRGPRTRARSVSGVVDRLSYVAGRRRSVRGGRRGGSGAACPGRTKLLSPGADTAGGFGDRTLQALRFKRRRAGAAASMLNRSERRLKIRAFGVCGARDGRYHLRSARRVVSGMSELYVQADCEPDEHVIGGGFKTNGGLRPLYSYPNDSIDDPDSVPDDGWIMASQGTQPSGSGVERVYALCREA